MNVKQDVHGQCAKFKSSCSVNVLGASMACDTSKEIRQF